MVPPPSAVMQPSMQTPAQSMLRRPAARAAVIAWAARATADRKYNTVSFGGRLRMADLAARFRRSLCRGHGAEQVEKAAPIRRDPEKVRGLGTSADTGYYHSGATEDPVDGRRTQPG